MLPNSYRYERDCQKAVLKYLKTLKPAGHFYKIAQGPYSQAGIADIKGTYRRRSLALETKSAKGKPTRLQEKFLRDHVAAGGVGSVIYNVHQVKDIIRKIDKEEG